jgi:hypothetical protein
MDKPRVLAEAVETPFYDLKSKFPLDLRIKYQRFSANERPLD